MCVVLELLYDLAGASATYSGGIYDTDGLELSCHRLTRFSTNKIYEGSKSIGFLIPLNAINVCIFRVPHMQRL